MPQTLIDPPAQGFIDRLEAFHLPTSDFSLDTQEQNSAMISDTVEVEGCSA
ncbi:MAG TPA: hypothetical protein V6D11_18545 [Waterburya sp.]